jgi:HAD superfamily hydrolase (TIGR01509 family)
MDGVIVDSEPLHERAFLEVVRDLGYGDRHGLRFADYVGRSDKELWADFVAWHSPSWSLAELLARKCARTADFIRREQPVFEGVRELIERLAARYPLALASGSERPVVEAVLDINGLGRFFAATVSASDVAHGKPAPEIFLKAAKRLGVEPVSCWVIEDSKPGVTAALAAGAQVIAIANTHPAHELVGATRVVTTYAEIGSLLLAEAASGAGGLAEKP